MELRAAIVVLVAGLVAACGGGAGPTAAPSAPAAPGDPSKVAQLDSATFDPLVLGGTRPSLVEFHSPT